MSTRFRLSDIFDWDSVHPSFWRFGMNSDELSKQNMVKSANVQMGNTMKNGSLGSPSVPRNLVGESRMRKYVADAQQIQIDGPNEADFSDIKALSALFTAIISKFRLNYSSLSFKLGMNEQEMINFLNAKEETLEESRNNVKKWIQTFVQWIKKHDPKTVTADFNFNIEDVLDFRPCPPALPIVVPQPIPASKKKKSVKLPSDDRGDPKFFKEWEELLLGDFVLAKDDSGIWHKVKITRREGTFLRLMYVSEQGQVEFWIDTSKRSSLITIPESTQRVLSERKKAMLI
eukprot:TRINITY_DN218_c0_g2_i4.p1 TRINITY_DN218_c0_g2~~TRINITY_DN218_c0_g2_i4.p1  ORF type:complete len:288 (-),score=73.36 TRINITY_DN218_c0_g2_i4:143-1006(-)